ncbi:hypothetical protein KVF89_22570 [Nocardioides carbamazepini]|uniref:hypothetical protein n=1 Tax=Nocardioides carbamazepini TaxID=2854259 RepID=UPI00214A85E9|nr:hypothetical protein [Nocardioides carbamazepini]MCR1785342.1 hypothetical protein [Nocardioides carbamazepini]
MSPDQLRKFADALEQLSEIRRTCGVVPGQSYDRPAIHLVDQDDSWELLWVEADDPEDSHYTAEPVRH